MFTQFFAFSSLLCNCLTVTATHKSEKLDCIRIMLDKIAIFRKILNCCSWDQSENYFSIKTKKEYPFINPSLTKCYCQYKLP